MELAGLADALVGGAHSAGARQHPAAAARDRRAGPGQDAAVDGVVPPEQLVPPANHREVDRQNAADGVASALDCDELLAGEGVRRPGALPPAQDCSV